MLRRSFIQNLLLSPFHAFARRSIVTAGGYILPFITKAFNSVDEDRLATVGPDRTCAEWVLKNGGSVRFAEYPERQTIVDYRELPDDFVPTTLTEIDLTGASVNGLGFNHLKGCSSLVSIVLSDSKGIDDKAINKLRFVGDTLTRLHLSKCENVTDHGLQKVHYLKNLKSFRCYQMKGVKNFEPIIKDLHDQLPKCEITLKEEKC